MAEYVTAFHGTSSSTLRKIREKNRVYGYFDTLRETCYEYAYRKAERDGSRPVVIEVKVPRKRFESNWVSAMQIRLGKRAVTGDLSLSYSRYVVAVWRLSKRRWSRRKIR